MVMSRAFKREIKTILPIPGGAVLRFFEETENSRGSKSSLYAGSSN